LPIPDFETANEMMEEEYRQLLREEYSLVKYGGLSRSDVLSMHKEDRSLYIEFLKEDQERQEREAAKARGSRTPHTPGSMGG
jgi:hypothetical protein